MNRLLLIITILLVCYEHANAQHDHVWAFGVYGGIDFNKRPPESFGTIISTGEGSASICDENGRLLFYTDGNTIYNRAHVPMRPGGNDIAMGGNTASTSQGAIIIPMLGDSTKFYVFSLLSYWNTETSGHPGRLMYSIVDMAAENGWGAVTTKGNIVADHLAEYMTAVSGNDCNVWLITVSLQDNSFRVFNIDVNGLNTTPVISPAYIQKSLYGYYELAGTIDVSPDRKKLVVPQERLLLYDFDVVNGRVSNPVVLDSIPIPNLRSRQDSVFGTYFGAVFSPDNSKLYTSVHSSVSDWPLDPDDIGVFQYDLSSGDPDTMADSKIKLSSSGRVFAMQRAPDGKIYGARQSNNLSVIHQPNLAGLACQYEEEGFQLQVGASVWGMPNTGTIYTHRRFYSTTLDSSYCSNPRTLTPKHINGWEYTWNDSLTDTTRVVDNPGIYWVRYKVPINSPCKYDIHVDTFRVAFALTSQYFDTTIYDAGMCKADTVLLQAINQYADDYFWEDGSTGSSRKVNRPGSYTVTYQVDSLCEYYRDNFVITYPEEDYKVSFTSDSIVCIGIPLQLDNTSHHMYTDFTWYFGNGDSSRLRNPDYTYDSSGSYNLQLVSFLNDLCRDTASLSVIADAPRDAFFTVEPLNICMGESITIHHNLEDSTLQQLHWKYSDGNTYYARNSPLQHAFDQPGYLSVMLTATYRACPASEYTANIYVAPLPHIDIGVDTGICINSTPLLLKNRSTSDNGQLRYLWNTGETTEQIKVTKPGIYSLTMREETSGCSATDYIEVAKDCYIDIPNVFTPNGDGVNDYFFPRQLLSSGVSGFHMQVFSRWGQLLFETVNPEGRGWDGRYNGQVQPAGVYVYRIEVSMLNDRVERFEGNVTLMR